MRNLKKFLALVLAMMMTLSLMVTVNAAKSPVAFDDVDKVSDTYAEAVNVLSALGVIKGQGADEAGQFKPKDPITRAETAMMLYRIAHNDAAGSQVDIYKDYDQFPDVKSDKWYAGAVNYCANSELIKGWGGAFHPSDNVTGYEVLAMVLRMIGYGQNNEFQGAGWQIQTARYGRLAGLTKNIKEGTLGQDATREVVAEIMFQALQADLVDYNMLRNYFASNVLLEDDATNRGRYSRAIAAGVVTLPLNADLMYVNYGIVGKSPRLTFDKFGRPSEMWVCDLDADSETETDSSNKYIPNDNQGGAGWGYDEEDATYGDEDAIFITAKMTPVAKYDNAVTECQVAKDVTGDKSVAWNTILEVLNGNSEANFDGTNGTDVGVTHTLAPKAADYSNNGVDRTGSMDALHTSDKWIGATGRTTEIYDVRGYNVTDGTNAQSYVIVYVDTYLAEVTDITAAVKDPNGHVIKAATATVEIGNNSGTPLKMTLASVGSHKVGDMVLVQTANADGTGIKAVEVGEKAPVVPEDVAYAAAKMATYFPTAGTNCSLLPNKTETKRVTIRGTKGVQDAKMGIETTNGDVLYASNTFLAGRIDTDNDPATNENTTVLAEWYDVDVAKKGITNSMIGRTFDVVLDHHGYIVGMKEVLTIQSNVGVITGYDQYRVGTGKYLTRVEAYMADGTTQTFDVVDMTITEAQKLGTTTAIDTSAFKFFTSGAAADDAWKTDTGVYAAAANGKLGIGSLVMFKQCTVDGVDAWYFVDASARTATAQLTDKNGDYVTDNNMVGSALQAATDSVDTGVAKTLNTGLTNSAADIEKQLDDKSVIFVAEPEYAYNTGSANEGNNSLKYNVHKGFRNMPTITAGVGPALSGGTGADSAVNNILYQQLVNNPEYVLVYPQNSGVEYIIRNQKTITVDESYLVLSRNATYAAYSEYNVLRNGKADKLQVSNSNDTLNLKIENAMKAGDLITVTGRNAAGYVISADTVAALALAGDDVAIANCGGVTNGNRGGVVNGANYDPRVPGTVTAAVITADATKKFSENDGVINFVDGTTAGGVEHGLTVANGCTVQLVNLGTGVVTDTTLSVAKVYINKEATRLLANCDFTFELDQYGYVCSLYIIEK